MQNIRENVGQIPENLKIHTNIANLSRSGNIMVSWLKVGFSKDKGG